MKKKLFSLFATRSLLVLLTVLGLVWNAGCGGGTGTGTTTASSADAQIAAEAVAIVGIEAIFLSLDSGAAMTLSSDYSKNVKAALFKTAFTTTPTSSCSERSLPSLSSAAQTTTLNGSLFTCQDNAGSGYCMVSHEETIGDTGKAIIDCTNLVVPVEISGGLTCDYVNLDGRIGVDYTISYSGDNTTYAIDYSSENLTEANMGCDLGLAFSVNQTTDNYSGSGTVNTNGCLAECGDAFTLTGSDTL
ncbi:MAG: hypothetical protein ABIA59_08700 [Candidatus Latescibacterota bacterium]